MNKRIHYKKQQDYFDKEFSMTFEYQLSPWQESYIERIKKYMLGKDFGKKKFLDIATGSGYVAIEMAKMGLDVTACDLSRKSIRNLQKYKKKLALHNLRLIRCKAEKIPLKDNTFDFVTANAILEHIPDEKKAIGEWKRLLKKKGRLFITVPLQFRYIWPFLWPINYLHDKRIGHLRRYSLEILAEQFNLKIRKYFYSGHLIKVVGILVSLLRKDRILEMYFEKQDKLRSRKKYGANNITVIFEKI